MRSTTNGNLVHISEGLSQLADEKFNVRFAYKVKLLMKVFQGMLETYIEARNDILERYAERDAAGEKIPLGDNAFKVQQPAFNDAIKELDAIETASFAGINLEELLTECEKNSAQLSARMLFALDGVLEESTPRISEVPEHKVKTGVQNGTAVETSAA